MRSFYLSLAVLALSLDITGAVSSASGLLRERKEEEHERRILNGSGTKGSKGKSGGTCGSSGSKGKGKGKGKSGGSLSPVCPSESVGKSKGKGKGKGKGKSDDPTTRFLEDVRFLSKGKGKGKSSGGDDCDCDYPTDLCAGEDVTTMENQIVCGATIMENTVLATPLGCPVGSGGMDAGEVDFAITVDGATLECTGDGQNPIYGTIGTSDIRPCVILRNGATLKNCDVFNCPVGVLMLGEGNNRIVGSTFYSNAFDVETSVADPAERGVQGTIDEGCYSIECSKFFGASQNSITVQHGGTFIMSDVEIRGSLSPVSVSPLQAYEIDVAFENLFIAGAVMEMMGTTVFGPAIRLAATPSEVPAWGKIGEVGFYGSNKFVRSGVAIRENWDKSENQKQAVPAEIIVYGGIESYDTISSSYEIRNAALMFEECSVATACTPGSDPDESPATVYSFDLNQSTDPADGPNVGLFMDMGAEFTCGQVADPATLPNAAGDPICPNNMCPPAPSTAFSCSGDSGTSKSKGKGKGSNGSKGKGKSATTP